MVGRLSTLLAAALVAACAADQQHLTPGNFPATALAGEPIIDVHRHAAWPGADDASARAAATAEMEANGIVLALLHINEPGDFPAWLDGAAGRFIAGPAMPCPVIRAGRSRAKPLLRSRSRKRHIRC